MTKIKRYRKKKSQYYVIITLFIVSFNYFFVLHEINLDDNAHSDIQNLENYNVKTSESFGYEWYRLFGGSSDDNFVDTYCDISGNIYVSGNIGESGVIAKYNTSGDLQWNITLYPIIKVTNIIVDSSGNIYCTTVNTSINSFGFNIVKLNGSGEHVWTTFWGLSVMDHAYGIALDSSEYLYITGATNPGVGSTDILLLKYDTNGNKLWERIRDLSGSYDSALDISIDHLDDIYIAGSAGGSWGEGFVVKYSSDGDIRDQIILSSYTYDIKGITTGNPSGGAYVLGRYNSWGPSFLMQLDFYLNIVWVLNFSDICMTPIDVEMKRFSNNLYVVVSDVFENFFIFYHITTSGIIIKEQYWNIPSLYPNIRAIGTCIDNDQNIYVTGNIESKSGGDEGALLVKFGHDTDEDGLTDYQELNIYYTEFNNPDTDGDMLQDGAEVYGVNNTAFGNEPTNPNLSDSDYDGLNDFEEITGILNINFGNQATNPNQNDTDFDGLLDNEEIYGLKNVAYSYDPTDPNNPDSDDDDVPDQDETTIYFTNPNNDDSDFDLLTDYEEISGDENDYYHNDPTDPNSDDSDEDGLLDYEEINDLRTNPNSNDTDSDGYLDGWEIANGYDPRNPNDPPNDYNQTIPSYDFPLLISMIIFSMMAIFLKNKRQYS
ncbi:MAG: hypothetical protein ACTSRT_15470 [Promethearchaeota archaeon]